MFKFKYFTIQYKFIHCFHTWFFFEWFYQILHMVSNIGNVPMTREPFWTISSIFRSTASVQVVWIHFEFIYDAVTRNFICSYKNPFPYHPTFSFQLSWKYVFYYFYEVKLYHYLLKMVSRRLFFKTVNCIAYSCEIICPKITKHIYLSSFFNEFYLVRYINITN